MATNVSEVINDAKFNLFHLRVCLLCALLVIEGHYSMDGDTLLLRFANSVDPVQIVIDF